MLYFVQFTAGTGSLLLDALDRQLKSLRVRYSDDSAMVLESSSAPTAISAIPYIKNAFVVISSTGRGGLDKGVTQLARVAEKSAFPSLPGPTGRFRVMVHVDGALAPLAPKAKSAIERTIAERTRSRVEARGNCQEFWVVGRQGMNEYLLCARLTKQAKRAKMKGSISHELSAMLIAASAPSARDVFLDPFAGSGSFPAARLQHPARQVWYSDLDLAEHRGSLSRALTADKRVRVLGEDALVLPSVADGSVDVIVTDPPWGEHEDLGRPYDDFARAVGRSFSRVLHPIRGRYVLLVNRRNAEVMEAGLAEVGLPVADTHEVLVNGHPATVLIGGRTRVGQDHRVREDAALP